MSMAQFLIVCITTNGHEQKFYIPEKVLTMFDDEFDYLFISNAQELTDMAVSIFVGLLAAQDVNVGIGGGGSENGCHREIKTMTT